MSISSVGGASALSQLYSAQSSSPSGSASQASAPAAMGSDPSLTTDAGAGDDSTEASLASALLNA